eukprot:TRINITY_DN13913_c0_g1_i5.p1 TRINITY_DN13913_c0_g1~~TRINITY_DN13913_c0_g1_i5.p1  ORF type:complete len:100 (+),score=14.48 TRINITY_DN13913_c0_g1_i5:408-707(+)
MTNHKTVACFVLKEKIQALIDDGTIKLAGNQNIENKATIDANPVFVLEKQEWEEITTRKKTNKKSSEGKTLEVITSNYPQEKTNVSKSKPLQQNEMLEK